MAMFVGKYNKWDKVDPAELFSQAPTEKKEANPKLNMVKFLQVCAADWGGGAWEVSVLASPQCRQAPESFPLSGTGRPLLDTGLPAISISAPCWPMRHLSGLFLALEPPTGPPGQASHWALESRNSVF